MNIVRGTVLMKLPLVLFLCLRVIEAQLGGPKAGKWYAIHKLDESQMLLLNNEIQYFGAYCRYGTKMLHIQNSL